jgi:polar amino acid transport system substrate-binding protein
MQMLKQFNFRLIVILMVVGLWGIPALAADVAFSKDSTLAGIIQRGELRIGLEVGYMPFEMIDTRSGLRQKEIRHGGLRQRGGRQLSLMGFDIDVGIEMAKALGVKPVFVDTLWTSIIPALNLGRFDIIFGGCRLPNHVSPSRFCRSFYDRGTDSPAQCQAHGNRSILQGPE